jgi:hypothetical protein
MMRTGQVFFEFHILEVSVQCLGLFWIEVLTEETGFALTYTQLPTHPHPPTIQLQMTNTHCLRGGHYNCVLLQRNKTLNQMKAKSVFYAVFQRVH